jgi:hypothetical protein
VSEELKPPKSLGSAAGAKAALGPRWPSAEAGLLGVWEAGKAPPGPWVFSAGSRLRRRWLASLGLLLLLPMVLAGGERGKLKSKEVVWPQELASQSLSFSICKMNTLMTLIKVFLGTAPDIKETDLPTAP